VWLAIGVKS